MPRPMAGRATPAPDASIRGRTATQIPSAVTGGMPPSQEAPVVDPLPADLALALAAWAERIGHDTPEWPVVRAAAARVCKEGA